MTDSITVSFGHWNAPVLALQHGDAAGLNSRLAQIIKMTEREIREGSPSVPVAGLTEGITTHWQSYNVLNWNYAECRELRAFIVSGISQFVDRYYAGDEDGHQILGISCWANILRHGEALTRHNHAPAFLLGNYLVQAGDLAGGWRGGDTLYYRPEDSTVIPLESKTDEQCQTIRVRPTEGKLLICPGEVFHEVTPFYGKGERISIAFDCFVKKQNPMIYLGDRSWRKLFDGPRWFVPREVV